MKLAILIMSFMFAGSAVAQANNWQNSPNNWNNSPNNWNNSANNWQNSPNNWQNSQNNWNATNGVYNNQGNWLYLSGRGTDPRGSRRFNPDKQAHDYDADGTYRELWR